MIFKKEMITLLRLIGKVEDFNNTKVYYPGQYVNYNNELKKFTTLHMPGGWLENDTIQTNFFNELKQIRLSTQENIHFFIYFEGGEDEGPGYRKSITVIVRDSNGDQTTTLTTDNDGYAEMSIELGKLYTVRVPNVAGYDTILEYPNLRAIGSDK